MVLAVGKGEELVQLVVRGGVSGASSGWGGGHL